MMSVLRQFFENLDLVEILGLSETLDFGGNPGHFKNLDLVEISSLSENLDLVGNTT